MSLRQHERVVTPTRMSRPTFPRGRAVRRPRHRRTLLVRACLDGDDARVSALIQAGKATGPADALMAACETTGRTAIMFAGHNGHEACVRALIRAGANIEHIALGRTCLEMACCDGHPLCAFALMDAGARISSCCEQKMPSLRRMYRWHRLRRCARGVERAAHCLVRLQMEMVERRYAPGGPGFLDCQRRRVGAGMRP